VSSRSRSCLGSTPGIDSLSLLVIAHSRVADFDV
jgi:hypothetical protein